MSRPNEPTILEIERILLATMMLRPGDCWRVNIVAEHFASEQHADILRAIQTRSQEAKPIDPVSLMDHFEQAGQPSIGQLALEIGNSGMLTPVPEPYAHRISTAWRQRKARDIGMELLKSTDEAAVDQAIASLMNLHAVEQNHEWDAKQATNAAFQELTTIHESGGKLPGVTTGLVDVDEKLGGLHRGDMIVIGGRAAMGKTSFLLGMARAAAKDGYPVGIISGEQPVKQMALRMLSSGLNIDSKKFRNAQFKDFEWSQLYGVVATNAALPMWFLDRSAPNMAEVSRVARRWKHKHGIKALYVDYLQRIGGEGERKYEQVSFVARGLKNLARDLDIPVVVLAQVSRAVEGRSSPIPKMGDLSDSSEIEKEADQVLMIYRAGYYSQDADQNTARVIVEKNRHGPTGYIDVHWQGSTMTFGDLSREYEDSLGGIA
ncbi:MULTISPECIES: DnaB-like helicase C-terminal domain-containing protein [unclassified Rhodanobacter]|uniref:replicative DNA helicase n=1 Tax=unclassified Rhodanobacter TaxID=2621553 RepID=UPI001BDEA2DC|nr:MULTISPECIES: DnaB-like helicase C-terminal domain-containing protein [unclassified Rhodanobacter]MBT2142706.1 AAA family ATPase [Rhodanobacter sp. LX-99]MBT2148221.1 AAA family ATPase [Rhodanobacter sp. LX-100]